MDNESLINSYFEGTLNPQEKVRFEQLMVTDASFAKEVAFQKQLKAAITLEERSNLKSTLKNLEKKPKSNSSRSWLYIAAGLLVLIGISFFFFNQNPTNEELYATYFEPYPNTVAPIVRSSSQQDSKQNAFASYENGDYKNASKLFGELGSTTQEEYAFFYNAISLMMLNEDQDASRILESTSWSDEYRGKADWYLSLSYIKQNQNEKAKTLLQSIIKNKSYNSDKARRILQDL